MSFPSLPKNPLVLAAATLLLAASGATALLVHAQDNKAPTAAPRPALTVTVTMPLRVTVATAVAANGNIAAWQEAIVGAEANGMRLADVLVNVGDVVRKGQVLARFDSAMAQAALAQSRATVAEAEAHLAEAAANAQRDVALRFTKQTVADQAAGHLVAFGAGERRVVDHEGHRHGRRIDRLRLQWRLDQRIAERVGDSALGQARDGDDVAGFGEFKRHALKTTEGENF